MKNIDRWLEALDQRHGRTFSKPELLKAIRALSARYVERRSELPNRSPIDSAGKRAAFALFYAPLHFLTVQRVVQALGTGARSTTTVVDLGCGTGVAGAAWVTAGTARPALLGVDTLGWAVDEAIWNWRTLALAGSVRRGDLVETAERLVARRRGEADAPGVVLGWSVNELPPAAQRRLLPVLIALGRHGSPILIIEPIARRMSPWYDAWSADFISAGGRADEWRFPADLPPILADLDDAAGFKRAELAARTLAINL